MGIIKKYVLAIILLNMIFGSSMAQNENRLFDSIRITMSTPYDAGVKWNCKCLIHDNLVSIWIKESCVGFVLSGKNIFVPSKVIYRYFELSDDKNQLLDGQKTFYLALSELAFDILINQDALRKKNDEEIESDTVWTVIVFKEGEAIDYFSIGNYCLSDNSRPIAQLSEIMERFVYFGRFLPLDVGKKSKTQLLE